MVNLIGFPFKIDNFDVGENNKEYNLLICKGIRFEKRKDGKGIERGTYKAEDSLG